MFLRVARIDDRRLHVAHRAFNPVDRLFGRETLQAGCGRQLDIDRHAVGVAAGRGDQFRVGIRDRLEVDIAAKAVILAQGPRDLDQLLHRVIRAADDARGEEQPLDVVALVEGQREIDDLLRGEAGAANVRTLAVDAIMAVENAAVGQQDLEQRNAATIGRISVANAHAFGRSDARRFARRAAFGSARRRARRIIFRRVGENFKLLTDIELGHVFPLGSRSRRVESMTYAKAAFRFIRSDTSSLNRMNATSPTPALATWSSQNVVVGSDEYSPPT